MLRLIHLLIFFIVFTSKDIFAINPYGLSTIHMPISIQPAASLPAIGDLRFGGGVGYGLYVTNQMDYEITRNFGDYKELLPTYFGAVYKKMNSNFELGLQGRFGSLLTLKSENTQGTSCDFNEIQISAVYSFTKDVAMDTKPYTINGIFSLGLTNFRSKYFTVNKFTQKEIRTLASVGYNGGIKSGKDQLERQTAVIGNIGFAAGYRFNKNFSVFWENTFNLSTSNKMTGNLHKKSWIPTDGYFYSSVGLYIRFGAKSGLIGCPKF
jgi:hypothetical protein